MRGTSVDYLQALAETASRYEAAGFTRVDPVRGSEFEELQLDLVMARDDEIVVVELKAQAPDVVDERTRMAALADLARRLGVRIDLVPYELSAGPPPPTSASLRARLNTLVPLLTAEADERLEQSNIEQAHLILSAIIEGGLWRLAAARGRRLPNRPWGVGLISLVRQLTIDGLISDRRAAELNSLGNVRNQIAHGFEPQSPLLSNDALRDLIQYAAALTDDGYTTPAEMAEWFVDQLSTVADPTTVDMATVVRRAAKTLPAEFVSAPDADIADAIALISGE